MATRRDRQWTGDRRHDQAAIEPLDIKDSHGVMKD